MKFRLTVEKENARFGHMNTQPMHNAVAKPKHKPPATAGVPVMRV